MKIILQIVCMMREDVMVNKAIEYLQQELKEKDKTISYIIKSLQAKTTECDELISGKDFYLQKIETLEDKCEELKKEIINKNEKIKELRFSVSDLTNRLCYLNAEKSFRIVDLEQALEEIEKVINNILNSCLGRNTVSCRPAHNVCGDLINILDIVNKAKEK